MVCLIKPAKAMALLKNQGPMKYRDLLGDLSSGPWVPAYIRRSLRVLVTGEGGCSLAIATGGTYGETEYTDVHLVTESPGDALELLDSLASPGELHLSIYDAGVARAVASCYRVAARTCQIHLHSRGGGRRQRGGEGEEQVIRLTRDHRGCVCWDSRVYHYWQVCTGSRRTGFACFAILREGLAASFCAIGPDVTGEVCGPTREILWIVTQEAHRRQGLARALLSDVTHHIVRGGATAYYCTRADNAASVATARSAGYVEHGRVYTFRAYPPEVRIWAEPGYRLL